MLDVQVQCQRGSLPLRDLVTYVLLPDGLNHAWYIRDFPMHDCIASTTSVQATGWESHTCVTGGTSWQEHVKGLLFDLIRVPVFPNYTMRLGEKKEQYKYTL